MGSHKERVSDLETVVGMMQDEISKINKGIRSMEESFKQMLSEAVSSIREGSSNAPQASRRSEGSQPSASVQRDMAYDQRHHISTIQVGVP